MNSDLVKIKKYYGEKMMHLCRELFPSLLEQTGLLFSILASKFAYSKCLVDDIIDDHNVNGFKKCILGLANFSKEIVDIDETPDELLREAGYILYECKTEEDIQEFKKYYKSGEELCTFNGARLRSCHVFFAIKKNVDEIKREDFKTPDRQDKYGTSVISIQFSRGYINTLSIKNRYNHIVNNPDATFSNNLDNIIPGLTSSFEKKYNLNINQNNEFDFELTNYVLAKDGKYYKYNYEINNIYYCPNNIIIDNFNVINDYMEKEKYIIMDYFILDLVNKKIVLYDCFMKDSFVDGINNIKKIEVTKDRNSNLKKVKLTFDDSNVATIELDKNNCIFSYENEKLREIGNNFLKYSQFIKNINIPNVETVGDGFLDANEDLKVIYLPKVQKIGNDFLSINDSLKEIDFPKLEIIGNNFLKNNSTLEEINLPNVKKIGYSFLTDNASLQKIKFPSLIEVGKNFLDGNKILEEIYLPNLRTIGGCFLEYNKKLTKLDLPNAVSIGNRFMTSNIKLEEINLPNVTTIGESFLYNNEALVSLKLPKATFIHSEFLYYNTELKHLEVPELISVESRFLYKNQKLKSLDCPNLKQVGNGFLQANEILSYFFAPELVSVGKYFLKSNLELTELNLPSLKYIENYFLSINDKLSSINMPQLETVGDYLLYSNTILKEIGKPFSIKRGFDLYEHNLQKRIKVKMLTKQKN